LPIYYTITLVGGFGFLTGSWSPPGRFHSKVIPQVDGVVLNEAIEVEPALLLLWIPPKEPPLTRTVISAARYSFVDNAQ
jgi:hypothetical protein